MYAATLAALVAGALFLGYHLYHLFITDSRRPRNINAAPYPYPSPSQHRYYRHQQPGYLLSLLQRITMSENADQSTVDDAGQEEGRPFRPKPMDVLIAKAMLGKKTKLPPEILDLVVDHAEYWPHSEATMEYTGRNKMRIKGGGRFKEDMFLVRSPPIGFGATPVRTVDGWTDIAAPPEPLDDEFPAEHFQKVLGGARLLEHPVRKIVFRIRSSDQGWANNQADRGSFRGSYTWFEAGLERFLRRRRAGQQQQQQQQQQQEEGEEGEGEGQDGRQEEEISPIIQQPFDSLNLRPVYPVRRLANDDGSSKRPTYALLANQQYKIQCNRVATREATDYEVTWSWRDNVDPESEEARELEERGRGKATATGEFVRNLKLGDVVTIWGKARFPGWSNNVERVSLEVYWAV